MAKCVLAALTKEKCGHDLIVLASILGVMNTTAILKEIPSELKSLAGDFMSLINLMNSILAMKQNTSLRQFNLKKACQAKGLDAIEHVLRPALRRYTDLEKAFNLSADYREKAQKKSGDWSSIAKSLLYGYGDNVFVSLKDLQGKIQFFERYQTDNRDLGILDLKCTLVRPSLVLARDVRFSSAVRSSAILSFVGEIKSEWLQKRVTQRLLLNAAEEKKLKDDDILNKVRQYFHNVQLKVDNGVLILEGPSGVTLAAQMDILRKLVVTLNFELENRCKPRTVEYENLKRNFEDYQECSTFLIP